MLILILLLQIVELQIAKNLFLTYLPLFMHNHVSLSRIHNISLIVDNKITLIVIKETKTYEFFFKL